MTWNHSVASVKKARTQFNQHSSDHNKNNYRISLNRKHHRLYIHHYFKYHQREKILTIKHDAKMLLIRKYTPNSEILKFTMYVF